MASDELMEVIEQARGFMKRTLSPGYYGYDFGMKLLDGYFGHEGTVFGAEFLEYAAYAGNTEAKYELGMCYRWGDGGVYAEPQKALHWFGRAAEDGHEKAAQLVEQFSSEEGMWIMFLSAISGAQGEGSKWYKAKLGVEEYYAMAQEGNGEAQYELARQLADPTHIGPFKYNISEAVKWYTQAAQNGVVDAMVNLAVIYLEGRPGVEADPECAMQWLKKAADAGDAEAIAYFEGQDK
ncbi:MAG: sel1 repeat family protein [Clostridia bacterium]|nr:sel1 repeat family protein [Clostridia bacterium]